MREPAKNVSASVRARLLNMARQPVEIFKSWLFDMSWNAFSLDWLRVSIETGSSSTVLCCSFHGISVTANNGGPRPAGTWQP